jgi:hypothetical protein
MSDKSTILRAFNKHFFEFLDDVSAVYPENMDIKYAKTSFETITKLNPTSIIKVWYYFIYSPYKDIIDAGNLDFFFNKDYSDDLSYLKNTDKIIAIINTLRDPMKSMSDENKAHCAEYLQNLNKLSMVYDGFLQK